MTKMEAINALVNGECDKIIKGKSEFILASGDVVNKRSKKALDTSKLLEDGWEVGIEPKWYDEIIGDNFKEFIGKAEGQFILVVGIEDGKFSTESDQYPFDDVTPATADEVLENLVIGGKPKKKRRSVKKKSEPEKIEGETDISQTGEEFCDQAAETQATEHATVREETCDSSTIDDVAENEMQKDYAESCTPAYTGQEAATCDAETMSKNPKTYGDAEEALAPEPEQVAEETTMDSTEGNDEMSQPQNGTSGVETTVVQKAEDEAPRTDGSPELKGNYKAPSEYARLTGVFLNAGLSIDEWDLFCEWAARKGYNLLKYVSNGRDAYYPLIPEFKEDLKTLENK
jgi:hypothetical protein